MPNMRLALEPFAHQADLLDEWEGGPPLPAHAFEHECRAARDALTAEGPDGRPDCGYCEERLRVNVGLLTENTSLRKKTGVNVDHDKLVKEVVEYAWHMAGHGGPVPKEDPDSPLMRSFYQGARAALREVIGV